MNTRQLFVSLLMMICHFVLAYSEQFFGGTVTWKPMNNTATGETIPIMITQSYQWSLESASCDQNQIISKSPMIPQNNESLICANGSSQCGDYVPISVQGYCTEFSNYSGTSSSQISSIQNITSGSKFCIMYAGQSWTELAIMNCNGNRRRRRRKTITEYNTRMSQLNSDMKRSRREVNTTTTTCFKSDLEYSIGCCIDLTPRSNGFINSPPVATIISRMYSSILTRLRNNYINSFSF